MIKYIGSKKSLLPQIVAIARALPDVRTACDLFSGTARVGHALKRAGLLVSANDHNTYAHVLAKCYVQADGSRLASGASRLIRELGAAKPRDGWFTEIYCKESRFFHPDNGRRIEGIREEILKLSVEPDLEAILLTSLMEAADRVDSTAGVQMAFLKKYPARATRELYLTLPRLAPGFGRAFCKDAVALAGEIETDLLYLDPPYNQHNYLSNYHIWETLCKWDYPAVYGVARKRVECKARGSAFNGKFKILPALRELMARARARFIVISLNNEGWVSRAEVEELARAAGHFEVVENDHARYMGAKIGIYNSSGKKVGKPGHLTNKEFIFIIGQDRKWLQIAARAGHQAIRNQGSQN